MRLAERVPGRGSSATRRWWIGMGSRWLSVMGAVLGGWQGWPYAERMFAYHELDRLSGAKARMALIAPPTPCTLSGVDG